MGYFYITGIAGSGKTSVCNELRSRGYAAYDTDDFGRWQNKNTGENVTRLASNQDTEWYEENIWKVRHSRLKRELAQHACDETVFVCGTSSNENNIRKMVDGVICLMVDPETLVQRLSERKNSDFGKSSAELNVITQWHLNLQDTHQRNGATMIDSQQPLENVVDQILSSISAPTEKKLLSA